MGDEFRLDSIVLYNSVTDFSVFWDDHETHEHSGIGHTESINRYFLAPKKKTKITYHITFYGMNEYGNREETFLGRKWRDGRYDSLSF